MSVGSLESKNATHNSLKAMSTCTPVEAFRDGTINRRRSSQSAKAMTLCSSGGASGQSKTPGPEMADLAALVVDEQPANSSFIGGSHVEFQSTFPQDLSDIEGITCGQFNKTFVNKMCILQV